MANTTSTPDATAGPGATRPARWVATGLGLGYAPAAPGTAGSLVSVGLFALLGAAFSGTLFSLVYLFVLVGLGLAAFWSTAQALPHWGVSDPQMIVIDEILGQWVAYGGIVLAGVVGLPLPVAGAGWKSLLAGFILFRAFDVLKPFPVRRSERLAGAAGVVLDDVLAGGYAAGGLLLLTWMGWLR